MMDTPLITEIHKRAFIIHARRHFRLKKSNGIFPAGYSKWCNFHSSRKFQLTSDGDHIQLVFLLLPDRRRHFFLSQHIIIDLDFLINQSTDFTIITLFTGFRERIKPYFTIPDPDKFCG